MARILVVDDLDEMRAWLRATLEAAGHTVEEAPHGEDALKRCAARPFELVITDILMPVMDGLELIRAFARQDAAPKVLAVSGGDSKVSANLALTAAAALGARAVH